MKKLLYLGFCLVLAMGVGCAITDYPVITDFYTGEVINTNGKALIANDSQIATIWADGADNLFTMIDQKANGDGTLNTYNYYTTDGTYFIDFDYCSPDWNGCAVATAENGGDMFDYTWNPNCRGARSLSLLLGALRYGECGRAPMTAVEKAEFITSLQQFGPNTVGGVLTRQSALISINSQMMRVYGATPFQIDFRSGAYATFDFSSPLSQLMVDQARDQFAGPAYVEIMYNGMDLGGYNLSIR